MTTPGDEPERVSPEVILARLRATHDVDEQRTLVEQVLALGYPWALQLEPEHLLLVQRRRPSSRRWLVGLAVFGALSLGLAGRNLWAITTAELNQTEVLPTSARSALNALNRQRVARAVENVEGLLRDGARTSAREAALRCAVIEHPDAARCAQLFVTTLEGLEGARGQQRLREATNAQAEVLAMVSGTKHWSGQPETSDEVDCVAQMRMVHPSDGSGRPRETVLPPCANDVLQARLESAVREPGGWNLREVLSWQDEMERATLQALERRW